MNAPLVSVRNVSKRFVRAPQLGDRIAAALSRRAARPQIVRAVNEVSFDLGERDWLGLVGESGCGKSTLGRIVAGIFTPDEGEALFRGAPIAQNSGSRVAKLTTLIQMIHQDPFASLNPRLRVGEAIVEGPRAHGLVDVKEQGRLARDMLVAVGLDPAYERRLPHQFSGGQRQRIAIARALAMRPEILVADEPVASLDVSVQAQVLNLFLALKQKLGLAAVFISHDIGVIRHICPAVAIMYLGRIVETGPTLEVTTKPAHPYTEALMRAVPRVGGRGRGFQAIRGEIPSPLNPPSGCAFHPRCPHAGPRCRIQVPTLTAIAPKRSAACHLVNGGTS